MADNLTPEQRSRNMSAIKANDTKPELIVRSLLHRLGYRFRLHRRDLPGKPDIVLPSRRKVILVHGCYWHMHDCRHGSVVPKTNAEYWLNKRVGNVTRDQKNIEALLKLDWKVFIVWECQTQDLPRLEKQLRKFLDG